MKRLFVSGTDTGIGKTVVSCALARGLVAKGRVLAPIRKNALYLSFTIVLKFHSAWEKNNKRVFSCIHFLSDSTHSSPPVLSFGVVHGREIIHGQ